MPLTIEWRRGLLPLSLATIGVIYFTLHPPMWVLILLCCVLPSFLLAQGLYVRKHLPAFDRAFNLALQQGDPAALQRILDQAGPLTWSAPPGTFEEKRGLLATVKEDWERADDELERAWVRRSGRAARDALLPAILRAKYQLGEWDEAEQIADEVVTRAPFPGTPHLFLGLILARRDGRQDEAVALLREASQVLAGKDRERAMAALQELAT